jgi:hypothetical protein
MRRLCVIGLAGLTVSAVVVSSASAAPKTLVLRTSAGPLPVGAQLTLASPHFPFQGRWGEFICTSVLTGDLENNGSRTDTVELTSATFAGFGEEACYVVVSKDGPAIVRAIDLPWEFTLDVDYAGTLTGTQELAYEAELITLKGSGDENHAKCIYARPNSIKTTSGFGQPLSVEIDAKTVGFRLASVASSLVCPDVMKWGSEFDEPSDWEVTSSGEVVEAVLK